jgi:signal transduction histidine kinase/PAS domain-containing protein
MVDETPEPDQAAETAGQTVSESDSTLKERLERQLTLLKGQIAQRKEAEEALRREGALARLLQEVAVAANQAESIEEAFQFTLDRICDLTGWPVGHVFFVPSRGREEAISSRLWYLADAERFEPLRRETESRRFAPESGWLGHILASGQPAWMADVNEEPGYLRAEALAAAGLRAGFAFPVLVASAVAAIVECYTAEPAAPDEALVQAMSHIGSQLGRVIERVRAGEALQRHQSLLASAERLAGLGSWEWDAGEDRLVLSDEMGRIYALGEGQSCQTMADLLRAVHPEDREGVAAIFDGARAKKVPFYTHHRVARPDGQVRTLLLHGKPLIDDEGELEGMLGTSQDVTEQREAEQTIARRAEQLAALTEMGQTVTGTLDLEMVYEKVLGHLLSLLGAAGVYILLLEGEDLVFAATNETRGRELTGQRVPATAGVAGRALASGRAIGLFGLPSSERVIHEIVEAVGYRPGALLAAPLRLGDELIGVMEAVHPEPDGFKDDDLRLLESAASWTAIAIGNARLFEQQRRARQAAEMLRDANLKLTQSLELPAVVETLLDHLIQLIDCDSSSVKLKYGSRLVLSGVRGRQGHDHSYDLNRLPEDHPLKLIAGSGRSLLIRSTAAFSGWDERLGRLGKVESWIGVPLLAGGELVGIYTAAAAQAGNFTERHLLLAEALAGQAAIAVQNARLFNQVQDGRDRLRYLTRQVVTAQEEERRRVSRELHDEAGQALTALKVTLELIRTSLPAEQAATRVQLAETSDLVDETMEHIRLLAHDLRPPVLDTFGLNTSLNGFCEDFARRTGLAIHYVGQDMPGLSDTAQISFYRFLQEALNNVAKHAGAGEVWVRLEQTDGSIALLVKDNGQGMVAADGPARASRSGIGLMGMQERFELLGGRVEIRSEPNQGTEVEASVPLEAGPKENTV